MATERKHYEKALVFGGADYAGSHGSAGALEYSIEAPAGANYGKATSIEVVHTRDNGERKNTDGKGGVRARTQSSPPDGDGI